MEPFSLLISLSRGCCKCGDRFYLKERAEELRTRLDHLKGYKIAIEEEVREKIIEQPWLSVHPNVVVWTQSVDVLSELVDVKIPKGDLPFWRRLCCCYTYALGDKIEQYLEDIMMLKDEYYNTIKDNLVIEVIPIDYLKMKLMTDMDDLRAKKRDLERKVLRLETAKAFPHRVRSEVVKLWIFRFDSLEAEVWLTNILYEHPSNIFPSFV